MGEKAKNFSAQFTVRLPAIIKKKNKWYASYCPVLDVASQGVSEEEAKKNLSEAVSLFLITCFEMGTLDTVMKECGFIPCHPQEETPSKELEDSEYINVPLPFIIDKTKSARCHA
jgi:predicted RNase H-like HicB family nuclease